MRFPYLICCYIHHTNIMKLRKPVWAKHQQRWFGKWHLYLGIIAGAILCIVGITGSILVFEHEIDYSLNRKFYEVKSHQKRIPIEDIIPIIQKNHPDKDFDYVYYMDETNPYIAYRFMDWHHNTEFFVNPFTAEILGGRNTGKSFTGIVTEIHRTLCLGQFGRYVVAFSTLSLLILTITGIRLWIPQQWKKWKEWRKALLVNFKANFKRQNLDWHNVLGLYSSPVVILLSVTGIAITFSTFYVAFLFVFTGNSPQSVAQIFDQHVEAPKNAKMLSTQKIAQIGYQLFPNSVLMGINVPEDEHHPYRLDFKTEKKIDTGNRILLFLNPYTGKVMLNSETDFPNVGNSYLSWLTPIHYGSFGGLPTKILAFIGGLIPLALFITGFIVWWPRYKYNQRTRDKVVLHKKLTKKQLQLQKIRELDFSAFTKFYLKKGLKYALMTLATAFVSGILYGAISGIIWQPALVGVIYIGITVLLNFLVALAVIIFNMIFVFPFRRTYKPVYKYFLLSMVFTVVFLPFCLAISWLSKDLF